MPAGIIGEWYYSFPFYFSKLTFLKNGTFRYFYQGCIGRSYSEGSWHYLGQYIICHSSDKYKIESASLQTVITSEPVTVPKGTGKKSRNKIEYSGNLSQHKTKVSFTFPDTSYVYFNNVRFMLENDILHKLDQYDGSGDIRYRRGEFRTMPAIPTAVLPEIWKANK